MKRILFLFTIILCVVTNVQAQQFPVQVTPQLLAPYTTQISEYYSAAGNPKLSLLLLNKDFNRPTLSVRLRMSIEGQGVRIKTREDVNFTPVTILAGQPYYISPAELQQYFNVNNIELSGITQQEYIQTGKLPEGFYTYCFETVETTTGQTVSNKGCSFAWINLNEPPFLNLPAKGESVIPAVSPTAQNITFYWTPRHTASPGASYTTTYIFTLVEITDNSLAPEAAFVNGMVRHVDSTNNSNYPYDNTKPILVEGKKYAWQVRAKTKDANNNIEVANFKNNGNSEVFWFLYKNNCPPVTGISDSLNGISGYRAIISWLGNPQHLGYKIVYREKNTPNAAWFNITTTGVQASLNDLKPATEYEYRVGTACEEGVFTFAGSRYFTTKDSTYTTVNVPNCGIDPNLVTPPNTSPLATLIPGDTIRAGDFKVVVTNNPTPTGSAGTFSGAGYVPVSYLGNMKLAVVFTSIGISNINNEKRLVSGQIQTTYDPSEGGIESIDDYIDYFVGGQGPSEITGLPQVDTTFGFPIQWPGGITMQAGFPPAGYNTTTGQGGPVTIVITPATPPGGAPINYTVNSLPKTIRDTTGNIYQVNANGTVTLIGQAGGDSLIRKMNKDLIDDDRAIVKFVEYNVPKVKYAFDEWKLVYEKSNTLNKEYQRIKTKNDEKYYVSAKAIAPAITDYLKASFTKTDASLRYDSIKFINSKGVIYNATLLDSIGGVYNYEVNIAGCPEKDAQTIYAVYPQTGAKNLNLGKVLVASYPRKEYKVKLVPVNGTTLTTQEVDSVKAKLKKTFEGVNVFISIELVANFQNSEWDLNNNNLLDISQTQVINTYSGEMKRLNNLYRKTPSYNDTSKYIFILNQASNSNVKGEMLRAAKFGYIFKNGNNLLEKTILHEIGHGIFNLNHITDYSGITENDLQDNLMSYGSLFTLTKAQWDLCADPAIYVPILDSDEEVQISAGTYFDPSGYPITLPNCIGKIYIDKIQSGEYINGPIYGWQNNGIEFGAKIVDEIFYGYYKKENDVLTTQIYNDNSTFINGSVINIIVYNYNFNCSIEKINAKHKATNKPSLQQYQNAGVVTINSLDYYEPVKEAKLIGIDGCTNDNFDVSNDLPSGSNAKKCFDKHKSKIDLTDLETVKALRRYALIVASMNYDDLYSYSESIELEFNKDFYWQYWPKYVVPPTYSKQYILEISNSLLKFKTFLTRLRTSSYDNNGTKFIKDIVDNLCKGGDRMKGTAGRTSFIKISTMRRIELIDLISKQPNMSGIKSVNECPKEEDVVLMLLGTATSEQSKIIIDELYRRKIINKFVKGIDGSQFDKFIEWISNAVIKHYYKSTESDAVKGKAINDAILANRFIVFNDSYLGRRNTEKVDTDDNIYLKVKRWFSNVEYEINCNPYDFILVQFKNKLTIGQTVFEKGQTYKLPAIYVYGLFNTDSREKILTSGKIAIDLALCFIGIGELKAAYNAANWGTVVLAAADIGIGLGDILISTVFKNEIQTKYPNFYRNWQTFSTLYGVARITMVGFSALKKDLKDDLNLIRNDATLTQQTRNGADNVAQKIEQEAGEVSANISTALSTLDGPLRNTYDDVLRFGGSSTEANGVITLYGKNGDEIAYIVDGKLMPMSYDYYRNLPNAVPIGQKTNGYQIVKDGDIMVVKRMPDKSPYSSSELSALTDHPNVHVLERHGHDVPDEALIRRAKTGIAPDGSFSGTASNPYKPPYSSKFDDADKLKQALNNTKPGSTAWATKTRQGNTNSYKVEYELTNGSYFGRGVPKDGNTFESMNKVLAIYEEVSPGNFKLVTMYPNK
jgi:TANFOR domain-containing protein